MIYYWSELLFRLGFILALPEYEGGIEKRTERPRKFVCNYDQASGRFFYFLMCQLVHRLAGYLGTYCI